MSSHYASAVDDNERMKLIQAAWLAACGHAEVRDEVQVVLCMDGLLEEMRRFIEDKTPEGVHGPTATLVALAQRPPPA